MKKDVSEKSAAPKKKKPALKKRGSGAEKEKAPGVKKQPRSHAPVLKGDDNTNPKEQAGYNLAKEIEQRRFDFSDFYEFYGKPGQESPARAPLSPRQRTKLATRRKLMAAARKLFAANGYNGTTPKDITDEAGVGYGSFYKHFEDKLDCYLAFIQDAREELIMAVHWFWPTEQDTPEVFLRVMFRTMFEYSLMNPGVLQETLGDVSILFSGDKKRVVGGAEYLASRIEKWKKAGLADRNLDSMLVSFLVSGANRLGDQMVSQDPDRMDEIVESLVNFVIYGLRSDRK